MLSELYGHHVDVIHVHGRVLVVAGRGDGLDIPLEHRAAHAVDDVRRLMGHLLRAIFEPGFFGSAPVHVALLVGGVVALVSGIVGTFTVMRGQSYAGHALGDISATGGSGVLPHRDQPAVGLRGHAAWWRPGSWT